MNKSFITPASLLEVRTSKGNKLLNPLEIIYIKGNNKYSVIYLFNNEIIEANHLLKWYEGKLESPFFLRCHASYIINSAFVDCICGCRFVLNGDIFIPISRERKKYALYDYKLFIQNQSVHLLQRDAVYSQKTLATQQ